MESFYEYFHVYHLFEKIEPIEGGYIVRLKPESVEEMLTEKDEGATASDLVKGADNRSRERGKDIKHKFVDLKNDGTMMFKTTSGTKKDGNHYYTQFIKLKDLNRNMYDNSDATLKDRIKLSLLGDIEVYCDCPAFLYYGYSYMASGIGYKYGSKEQRYPKVNNPDTKGTVCKHLYAILRRINFQDGRIITAIENIFDKR